MSWLLVNKILSFIGPKLRALYLSFTPASLAAVLGVNHLWAKGHIEVNITAAFAFYSLSAITYSFVRFVHHVCCPELIKGVNDQKEFFSRKNEILKQANEIVAKLRQVEREKVQSELMGVLSEAEASRIADKIAARIYSVSDTVPEMGQRMEECSEGRPALLACTALLCLCGVLSLASLGVVLGPLLFAVSERLRNIW